MQARVPPATGRRGPRARRPTPSWLRCDLEQVASQAHQGIEVVDGHEIVAMRERGDHASSEGLVTVLTEQWIQPDHPPRASPQRRHLTAEANRVTPIPAVRKHDDDSVPTH